MSHEVLFVRDAHHWFAIPGTDVLGVDVAQPGDERLATAVGFVADAAFDDAPRALLIAGRRLRTTEVRALAVIRDEDIFVMPAVLAGRTSPVRAFVALGDAFVTESNKGIAREGAVVALALLLDANLLRDAVRGTADELPR